MSQEQADRICSCRRWPDVLHDDPAWEWTPVYNPRSEYEGEVTGLSGLALFPELSNADVPFTHPFGFDWETYIVPDPAYLPLLAPSNAGRQGHEDLEQFIRVKQAREAGLLGAQRGLFGIETDQNLIPEPYRAQEMDRVAVFGRWIVDCGHPDFHTEIHPPLLFATARAVPAGSEPDRPTSGERTVTFSRVIGRPFLVSQEFGDGAFRAHLLKEIKKLFSAVLSKRLEAHPRIYRIPFSGVHRLTYVVRPPVPQPVPEPGSKPDVKYALTARFHFTVRTGVTVQVVPESSDAVKVIIEMNSDNYKLANLPRVNDHFDVSFDQLKQWNPDTKPFIDHVLDAAKICALLQVSTCDVGSVQLLRRQYIRTDLYWALEPASPRDREVITFPVVPGYEPPQQHFSVDDNQPFPIYGWLTLEWSQFKQVPSVTPERPLELDGPRTR